MHTMYVCIYYVARPLNLFGNGEYEESKHTHDDNL